MAYNVFKRPMFKRGGSTTGTGIMSHVESKTIGGGAISGNNMSNNRTGFQNPNLSNPPNMRGIFTQGQTPVSSGTSGSRFLNLLNKFPKISPSVGGAATTAGLYGAGAGAGIALGGLLDFYARSTKTPEQMRRIKEMSEFGIMDETNLDVGEVMKYIEEGGKIGEAPGFFPRGGKEKFFKDKGLDPKTGLPIKDDFEVSGGIATLQPGETSMDAVMRQGIDTAARRAAAKEDGPGLKEEPKYVESDARGEIEKEADLIKDLLKDQGLEKAELAFLIGDALKTPGSIADKLETAREKGMKIAAGKKKTDREATLLAYKAFKDKESAKIKAGEKTSTQKAIDDYTALSTKKNLTEQDKVKLGALERVIMGSSDSTLKAYAVSSAPLGDILNLQSDIQKLQALEKPSEDQLKKLEQSRQELNLKLKLLQSAGVDLNKILQGGLKEGGRVMRAMGDPDPMQASIESTEVPEGNTEMPVKTVNKLSYSELRDRLPREITDDIVTLLANSEQALQDFAYLRTQQDINDFNVKYGVNVVLPPNKA